MALTDRQLDRYARHIVLRDIGGAGQKKLLQSHVLIIGAGGIGCPAIQYLAAAGVGALTVIDHDSVSLSNLQRQVLYTENMIGSPKVQMAEQAVGQLNPHIHFTALNQKLTAQQFSQHGAAFFAPFDAIIDGSDNYATRLLVSDESVKARVPLVSAAIGRFQGQLGTFRGWEADKPCYRCFVGDAHDSDDCDDCATAGVLGALCGVMGSWAAMEAIRVITGFGEDPAGKLLLFDGLKPEMRAIRLPKDASCSGCSTIAVGEAITAQPA